MAEIKVTKKEKFGMVLALPAIQESEMLKAFIENEIELLNKKNARGSVSKKANAENEKVTETILAELAKMDSPVTITELMSKSEVIKGIVLENGKPLSNQKIRSLLSTPIENKVVVSVKDKKSVKFSIATDSEDAE